jgi:NAD(P)-dependent dehydrogenase (short-subunit alcohol dehydrogenase family)
MNQENKIAVVTGGSRGLGRNMAYRLAEKGFDVIITWNTQHQLADEVIQSMESLGCRAAALKLDVSDIQSLNSFVTDLITLLKIKWQTEKFDCLVNNAGVGATIPFVEATENDFDHLMNIHLKSVYFLTQQCLPFINDGGRIINISSGSLRYCVPGYSIYASMKGAIETFTRYLAKEIGPRKITANVVAPGPIETDFNNAAIRNNPNQKKYLESITALGRVGKAEDIGGVVAFLCSEDGGWINGQRIEVSGGVSL